jgi:hypothetical protein
MNKLILEAIERFMKEEGDTLLESNKLNLEEKKKTRTQGNKKPSNQKLYNKIKGQAKKKFDVYPSRYASYWISQEYKKQGGTYK